MKYQYLKRFSKYSEKTLLDRVIDVSIDFNKKTGLYLSLDGVSDKYFNWSEIKECSIDEMLLCLLPIEKMTKSMEILKSSYRLKHDTEVVIKHLKCKHYYISNGALILVLLLSNYTIYYELNSTNIFIKRKLSIMELINGVGNG